MTDSHRLTLLRHTMWTTGALFTVGFALLSRLWPEGWSWGTPHQTMTHALYATLGVCLMVGAREPLAQRGLIWFTIWLSTVQATLGLFQARENPALVDHLIGDVPVLFFVAAALTLLAPAYGGSYVTTRRPAQAMRTPERSPAVLQGAG